MIAEDLQRDLSEVARALERLGAEHPKCLSCHCYREVVEEALASSVLVLGHVELLAGDVDPAPGADAERLRRLLDSSEGTHG